MSEASARRMEADPDSRIFDRIVELGAQSLKVHAHRNGHLETVKHPYCLGHEVFTNGRITNRTINKILSVARSNGLPTLVLGTDAVRDAKNSSSLLECLRQLPRTRVHVLTCYEEASILARGYLSRFKTLPAFVVDVGGGSLKVLYLTRTRAFVWDSLPLGVIRLHHKHVRDGLSEMTHWIDAQFDRASLVISHSIHATGGPVKAIARALGKLTFTLADVAALEAQVLTEGPPIRLHRARSRVFLAGVSLMRKLLEFVNADEAIYIDLSVGKRVLSERLRGYS